MRAHRKADRLVCGATISVSVNKHTLKRSAVSFDPELIDPAHLTLKHRSAWLNTHRPWMACTGPNFSIRRKDGEFFDEAFEGWGSEDRDLSYRLYEKGLHVHLLRRVGAIDVRVKGAAVPWNPFKGADTAGVVALLKSKLTLFRKYPDDLMTPRTGARGHPANPLSKAAYRRRRLDAITRSFA